MNHKLPKRKSKRKKSLHCFKNASFVQIFVINPGKTNANPITLPATAASNSPAFVIPQFLPLLTGF